MTTRQEQVRAWTEMVSSHFTHLSAPQAAVLALYSFAAMLAQSALLTGCAFLLASALEQKYNTVRQRLKEFYKDAPHKKGAHRKALAPETCFAPLLRWVLELWPSRKITLALDPSLCRDRFACLCVSLVYEGGSVPLAWAVVPANQEGAWAPHWSKLLARLSDALSEEEEVIVLADRGLFSNQLFEEITALGLHPMLRLTKLGHWREQGRQAWLSLGSILPGAGHYYVGRGHMFKTRPSLACTLIVLWEQGSEAPWYLVTDLPEQRCSGAFYGLRSWIEQGFRTVKSHGLDWERSRIEQAERMERLWLVYALSLLWRQAVAGEIEARPEAMLGLGLARSDLFGREGRRISRFRLGLLAILVALLGQRSLPLPRQLNPGAAPMMSDLMRVYLPQEQQLE